jgi:hypothetical protein
LSSGIFAGWGRRVARGARGGGEHERRGHGESLKKSVFHVLKEVTRRAPKVFHKPCARK